ncbi:MAG: NUDIX domain-containing protein [Devosia sp.]
MSKTIFAASVALLRQPEVLLIQRNRAPSEGLWTLPGGRLEPGETAEAAAAREVKEELGLYAFALRPVRTLMLGKNRDFPLAVFATEGFEGEIVPDPAELRAWRWVRMEQLRGLKTTYDLAPVLEAVFRMFDRT